MDQTKTDTKFFTNTNSDKLCDRLKLLMSESKNFDILVGYFFTSGFFLMHEYLEKVEKIRILVGLSTNKKTIELINQANQQQLLLSVQNHKETYENNLCEEINNSSINTNDDQKIAIACEKFIEFINNKKLEIKIHKSQNIHAKIYIGTLNSKLDKGRVITGSSNFSQSGLHDQYEFNVELRDDRDYDFAKQKFDDLWQEGIDITQDYVNIINTKTWLNNQITPYQIYLKFLYEYFKEQIEQPELDISEFPNNFKQLKYQSDAVLTAQKIINNYNGVFLSDVVGLGKTFMGVMLCKNLNKKVLVIAPPHLVDENNLGGWNFAFKEFGFKANQFDCVSLGKLDKVIEKEIYKNYEIILIDESHRFRSAMSDNYSNLNSICQGKKVILISATPYNNSTTDLLSQIGLFQPTRKSDIPNLANLEAFFSSLNKRLKGLDRQTNKEEYLKITKQNAKEIRQKVLKYLMVRRTRKEIAKNYQEDLKEQKIKFPEIKNPKPIYYEFNETEDQIFTQTLNYIDKEISFSRYTPNLYLYDEFKDSKNDQGQTNMKGFMKTILIKRLESSFPAFKKTIDRFIDSYEKFIKQYHKGWVYISKAYSKKIYEYLENDELEKIDQLLEQEKAEKFESNQFKKDFIEKLNYDLAILTNLKNQWHQNIKRDPKIMAFQEKLANETPFKQEKSIIFTESEETAKYLEDELNETFNNQILCFTGKDSKSKREIVLNNFDANCKNPKNDFKILITTDVLAAGINLHRADVVVNYDIPWNPAKMMQRVGRINRVDTKFDKIYTYTFFPTKQANDVIKLKELAEGKISAFINLLGNDAKLLTDNEEITSHKLFQNLFSKEIIEGEEEPDSELEYLQEIRKVYQEDKKLFEQIKRLPKKSRSSTFANSNQSKLVTYFKKGNLSKFFEVNDAIETAKELDFVETAKILKTNKDQIKTNFDEKFYQLLTLNKDCYNRSLQENSEISNSKNSNYKSLVDSIKFVKKYCQSSDNLDHEDIEFLNKIILAVEEGKIDPKRIKDINSDFKKLDLKNKPIELVNYLKNKIQSQFYETNLTKEKQQNKYQSEVILSQYFKNNF
ncbi:MAG: phospholipase D-like domain-containing protein [Rickettsiales bacterium]|nr:phospholipase D-like domain-containing protein [Rickettsiales bacterium]